MSKKRTNATAQAQAIPTIPAQATLTAPAPAPAPVQEPAPAPTPEPATQATAQAQAIPTSAINGLTANQQQVLVDIIRSMSAEQLMAFMTASQTAPMTAPTQEPASTQEPAVAAPEPTQEPVVEAEPTAPVTEFYEVPVGTPVNFVNNVCYTTEGGQNMENKNMKIIDTRKNEFERDLNRAGLSKLEALDLIAKGRACGEFGTNDVLSIQKRADILRDFDRREQDHIDAQLRRAELEAKAKVNGKKNGLTTGQKVWIAVGVAAVVLIIGGAIWYIIQKKKAADAFNDEFAEETAARCDRVFTARGLAI